MLVAMLQERPFGACQMQQSCKQQTTAMRAFLVCRYSMLQERLQANIEPVALLGGIDREAVAIESSFSALVKHTQRVLQAQLYSGITSDFLLKYLGATVAVVLIIGPFFGGHMKPDATLLGRAQMLSDMRYHTRCASYWRMGRKYPAGYTRVPVSVYPST